MASFVQTSLSTLLLTFVLAACATVPPLAPDRLPLADEYLGTARPENGSALFAPGIISTHLRERDITFAAAGREIYYTVTIGARSSIAVVRYRRGAWTSPEVAAFSGEFNDAEPHVTPDGRRLYFASDRPTERSDPRRNYDLWYVERLERTWGPAVNVGAPVNTPADEFYPCTTTAGALYFTARYPSGHGDDLYCAKPTHPGFQKPERLAAPVNSKDDEYNAFVTPDGNTILFGRGARLWISHRKKNGAFTNARDLTPALGRPGAGAMSPSVTPDGRFLFFTAGVVPAHDIPHATAVEQALARRVRGIDPDRSPPRGHQDLYWISTSLLDPLRD